MSDLIPPDFEQCQTNRPSTWPEMPSFMTLGPVSWQRCQNRPEWLATSREDGGQMTLCNECREVMTSLFGSEVELVGVVTVRVEVVTPCPKCEGLGTRHDPFQLECSFCNGSGDEDRRTLTEWPPEAIEAAAEAIYETGRTPFIPEPEWADQVHFVQQEYRETAKAALAAAWGHITGANK